MSHDYCFCRFVCLFILKEKDRKEKEGSQGQEGREQVVMRIGSVTGTEYATDENPTFHFFACQEVCSCVLCIWRVEVVQSATGTL